MTMVAEGVEDGETAGQLALSRCDKIQGFYFSKALPSAELELWMDAREPSSTSLSVPTPDAEPAL
jgi:EAL domain-containing protein (putative c-di-GMP-specific phosphodiesterase class I)